VVALAACATPSPCSRSCGAHNAAKVPAGEACADWAAHYCKRLEACAPISVSIDYGDVETCILRNKPVCVSALQARGTGASPSTLSSCALAYDSARCDDVVVGKPPEACHAPGLLGAGASCGDSSQCAGPHAYCRMAAEETCGVCAPLGDLGAGCDSARDCEYGLVCYFTCLRPVAKGDTCDGMLQQCPETLVCLNYKCVVPAGRDSPCEPNADHCDHDHGLFCDPEEKVCVPYAVADEGAECGTGIVCKHGACIPDETTGVSRCIANIPDGASCSAPRGAPCAAPARCVNARCRTPSAATCL
jgi:hypothetical protein